MPAAIMALVVISALVAAAVTISTEELRSGRTDLASHRAFAGAELALERALATWDARLNTSMRIGETRVLAAAVDARGDSALVTATRSRERAFWIASRGTSGADGRPIPARTTIGAAMRLLVPAAPLDAALTVGGAATIDGGIVDGRDVAETAPVTDMCPVADPTDVAGIFAPDSTRVCGSECNGALPAGIVGTPPIATSGSLTSDSGAASGMWRALVDRATVTVAGGDLRPRPIVANDECARSDPLNWGDPAGSGPCADHLPVIHVTGDAVLATGAVGQGILLVDGSLLVASGARYSGVVLARNDVIVAGTGAELSGVVLALDADRLAGSIVRDGGAVRFGRCAARRALLGAGRLTRTPERWWAELR